MDNGQIGHLVRVKTAQGQEIGVGMVIAYTDLATFSVQMADGQRINWLAELTEPLDIEHSCGRWTWADGNYCTGCGAALKIP